MRFLYYTFLALVSLGFLGLIAAVAGLIYIFSYFGHDLPDYSQLKDYKPPVVSRLYAGDGRLMEEYAEEKRIFIPIEEIPPVVKYAFIAAEDKNFYSHEGLDYIAILRAMLKNIQKLGSGQRPEGASTITQQVAKNFLLTNEVSYKRKIREAILAFRMERALTKDRLLELYLNEIFLGGGAYGVAAAAQRYFDKALDELEIHEAAYLAALPKAPNNYHPARNHDRALERRNWVISRLEEDGYITKAQADIAQARPLISATTDSVERVSGPYFAEEVRRELEEKYGRESLYSGGLAVRTTMDPRLQEVATRALRDGLTTYDRRHGWRGEIHRYDDLSDWQDKLVRYGRHPGLLENWRSGVVLDVSANAATLGFADGSKDTLNLSGASWANKESMTALVETGDVIAVSKDAETGDLTLEQIPEVQGAILAMDPHTGRILAMQGGWSARESAFNRATQAWRQPGSAFKPVVYSVALDRGFTPATLVLDAPFVIEDRPGHFWKPENYTHEYYGPTPIRVGIEKSKNLMTVRLADYVGPEAIAEQARTFGVVDDMKPLLANALGATETTLLRLTTAYAQFVNGGYKLTPTLIDRIQDRRGRTIYAHDTRPCLDCGAMIRWDGQPVPDVPDTRERILDPRIAYQLVSMMEGVVQRGTGIRLKSLKWPLAGKTGTTNESRDAWFIGFTPDLVAGVYIGYDEPRSLGRRETGSSVAVPIFKQFMAEALEDEPPMPFRVPSGIRQVRINAETGTRARPGDENLIWEAFITGTEPTGEMFMLDESGIRQVSIEDTRHMRADPEAMGGYRQDYDRQAPTAASRKAVTTGTGGLY